MLRYVAIFIPCLALSAGSPIQASQHLTAGVLTCTVEPEDRRVRPLACSFHPSAGGPDARFTGAIARVGLEPQIESNRVLVWMVIGPAGLEAEDIEGRFVRKNPPGAVVAKKYKEGLVGGSDDTIALVPPSGREQIPGNAALTVIELDLKALKI